MLEIVEERFQARLSKIRDGEASEGSRRGTPDDLLAADPPAVADQGALALALPSTNQKGASRPRNNPEATWSMLWANRFGFAIRSTVSSYSDSPAWCAAACHRIRITSHSHSRVQWDDA